MTGTDRSCGVRSVWTAAVERQRVNGLLVLDRPDINMVCVSGGGDPGRSGRWTARTHKINKTSNNNNTPARAEKFPWPPFPSPSLLPPCACLSVCLCPVWLPSPTASFLRLQLAKTRGVRHALLPRANHARSPPVPRRQTLSSVPGEGASPQLTSAADRRGDRRSCYRRSSASIVVGGGRK